MVVFSKIIHNDKTYDVYYELKAWFMSCFCWDHGMCYIQQYWDILSYDDDNKLA